MRTEPRVGSLEFCFEGDDWYESDRIRGLRIFQRKIDGWYETGDAKPLDWGDLLRLGTKPVIKSPVFYNYSERTQVERAAIK